jgi:hypothetical protein
MATPPPLLTGAAAAFAALAARLREIFNSVLLVNDDVPPDPSSDAAFASLRAAGATRTALRHCSQHARIVALLRASSLLNKRFLFIEFGAGRAGLSHAVADAVGGGEMLFIERGGVRRKLDKNVDKSQRLRVDIKDLNLTKVESVSQNKAGVVAIAKHLYPPPPRLCPLPP